MSKRFMAYASGSFLVGLLLIGVYVTNTANASTGNKYIFSVRGIVKGVNASDHTLSVAVSHANDQAKEDLSGVRHDFNVKPAQFFKWTKGIKKRVKIGGVVVGDEVVMSGTARGNDVYNVSWVVVNDRSFEVVGKIKENNLTDKTLKVLIGTSTYKQSTYAGQTILIHYDSNTVFTSHGKEKNSDETTGNNQTIKVKGLVNDESTWSATSVIDDYSGK